MKRWGPSFLWFLLSLILLWLLHPAIGIRDEDAFQYLIGADSIRLGLGFTQADGSPIHPWPSTYSHLLSIFSNSITAAQWMNYLSFALANVLMFALFIKNGWSVACASGATLFWSANFFRTIATNASPDTLTYALFLFGILSLRTPYRTFIAFLIASAFKALGLLFVPALLLFLRKKRYLWWLIPWGAISIWNGRYYLKHFLTYYPSGKFLETSIWTRAEVFAHSFYWILRESIWGWYGSIRSTSLVFCCMAFLAIAIFCFSQLRLRNHFWKFSLAYLVPLYALPLVFGMPMHLRHSGYGWIVFMASFCPPSPKHKSWYALGACCLAFSITNAFLSPSIGGNSALLRADAKEIAGMPLPKGIIETNSHKILDLYARIATEQKAAPTTDYYLHLTRPNPDALATVLLETTLDSRDWCTAWQLPHAELLSRCVLQ